jgi:hypothetical protein
MMNDKNIPNPAYNEESGFDSYAKDAEVKAVKNKPTEKDKSEELLAAVIDDSHEYTFPSLAIGEDSSYYINIFKKISQGKIIVPSKYAGIFGLSWLIYRKASYYGFLVYIALLFFAYNVITKLLFLPKTLQIVSILLFAHVVFYFIGNFIYWYSIRKKVNNCRKRYGDTSAMTYLSQHGGEITGFALISVVLMLQGGAILILAGSVYIDEFLLHLWDNFIALAHFGK